MTPADLRALADRVERLTGPDREVDAEIAVCVWGLTQIPDRMRGVYRTKDGGVVSIYDSPFSGPRAPMFEGHWPSMTGWTAYDIPPFTASLDAAASLVPASRGWCVGYDSGTRLGGPGEFASIQDDDSYWPGDNIHAATPALSLTAAALRARADMGDAM